MATQTDHMKLTKPALNESADITVINTNMDIVDQVTSKILPVITGSINNSGYPIASGEYFEADGNMYKATQAIPTGQAWSSSATQLSSNGIINALNGDIGTLNADVATRLKWKTVEVSAATLGTAWSQTSRDAGSVGTLFGLDEDKIVSINSRQANFSPAANPIYGIYNNHLYVAATQTTTLQSSIIFAIAYHD